MGGIETRSARLFLVRVEKLVPRLKVTSWLDEQGPKGIIQLQKDIASLQHDIQREISRLKSSHKTAKAERGTIGELEWVLIQARGLGDTLAWTFLAEDPHAIEPLTENRRVPISPQEDDGSRGVFEMAERLMFSGWGIPIVHDITDCLRIGDITFMDAKGKRPNREFVYRTVEVKTHRVSAVKNDDGTETVELRATVISHAVPDEFRDAVEAQQAARPTGPEARKAPDDRRLREQMRRMEVAAAKQDAKEGSLHNVGGMPLLTVVLDEHISTDWKMVRRAIREAHRDGHSSIPGSSLVSWIFIYNSKGWEPEDLQHPKLAQAAQDFLRRSPKTSDNILTIATVPPDRDEGSNPRARPLLLWQVPKRAKFEIMRRKLVIMAMINTAGLEAAIKEAGYEVIPSPGKDKRAFQIKTEIEWPDGTKAHFLRPMPWREVGDAVQDFTGLEGVMQKVHAISQLRGIDLGDLVPAWKRAKAPSSEGQAVGLSAETA